MQSPAMRSKSRLAAAGPWALVVLYLAVALEVVIMISPFTAYFYTIYAPVLRQLEARPATAWLTAFFLPHITRTQNPLLTVRAFSAPALLGAGLLIFLAGAVQVYTAKLRKRGVVSGGLYATVRHPQYLGLAVAGLGLLLYWPRFIILVLYLTMLLVYYLLARDEERRMTARFGDGYRAYAATRPMFLPWRRGRGIVGWRLEAWRSGAAAAGIVFGLTLVGSLGAAAWLRVYSKTQLTTVRAANVLAISMTGGNATTLFRRLEAALGDREVQQRLQQHPATHGLVAYVLPQDYMMQHLIADLGEHEAHHGGRNSSGLLAALGHLGEMYALKPLRQLSQGAGSSRQRIIFTMAATPAGQPVPVERALAVEVLRYPLFFVDLDGPAVTMTMDTPPRHAWGSIPVPAF